MDYIFKITIPFQAIDDIEAREIAKKIKDSYDKNFHYDKEEIKLQRIYNDKPPKKINL